MAVTTWPAEAVQPKTFVAVTVYVAEVVVVIADVPAPVLQLYDVPPDAVKVTLPPTQKVVVPEAAIEAVGLLNNVLPKRGVVVKYLIQAPLPLYENMR